MGPGYYHPNYDIIKPKTKVAKVGQNDFYYQREYDR